MIAFGGFELLVLLALLASPLIGVWNFLDATAREIDMPVLTYRYRGLALHQQGELDMAIETFNQAIKVMPEAPWNYLSRGLAYEDKGELDLALKDFNTTLQRRSDDTCPYRDRGRVYRRKGEYDKALADSNTVMEMSMDFSTLGRAYYGRGRVYLDKGSRKQVLHDLSQSIHFDALPGPTFMEFPPASENRCRGAVSCLWRTSSVPRGNRVALSRLPQR